MATHLGEPGAVEVLGTVDLEGAGRGREGRGATGARLETISGGCRAWPPGDAPPRVPSPSLYGLIVKVIFFGEAVI